LDKKPATLVVALYASPANNTVANAASSFSESTQQSGQSNVLTQFAVAAQSITPAVMWGLLILLFAVAVSVVTHSNRRKLSQTLRKTWYRHHGIIKAIGFTVLGLVVIYMYGGGQI
jgi:ABC-type dipeptide/oligopeptide/nickel transport system permease component